MEPKEQPAPDAMEADLLNLANQVDSGAMDIDDVPDVVSERIAEADAAAKEAAGQPNPAPEPEPEAPDTGGQDTEEEKPEEISEEEAPEPKPTDEGTQPDAEAAADTAEAEAEDKTEKDKEKGAERFDRNWKEFQSEKEAFHAERDAFREEQESFARKQRINQELMDYREQRLKAEKPLTADDYEQAAEKWEKEGNLEYAEQAREEAVRLRANPPVQPKFLPLELDPDSEQFRLAQTQALDEVRKEHPDLRNKGSDLYNRTLDLVKQYPVAVKFPQGMAIAGRMAATMIEAQRLQARVKELETEVERLNKATALNEQPAGGGARKAPSPGGPLTEAQMLAAARQADAMGSAPVGVD